MPSVTQKQTNQTQTLMKGYCAGLHHNGFQHLDIDLAGLEKEYDLGYKFEEKENWTEPYLALYVSVRHRKNNPDVLPTLHYGLPRTAYATGLKATEEDCDRLLELAQPSVKGDIAAVDSEQSLPHLDLDQPRIVAQ